MRFYSTNHEAPAATLSQAIERGIAPDGGLYLPQEITPLPIPFFRNIAEMPATDIAYVVANTFLAEDFEPETVRAIVNSALSFPMPMLQLDGTHIATMELFHGPTKSVKDIGAQFMASLLRTIRGNNATPVNIIAATSGDAGSAVASAFHSLPGVHVTLLYPKGRLTYQQRQSFVSLGHDVTPVEVRGSFDDCLALARNATLDPDLAGHVRTITANSINIARFLPQTFHFFNAFARMVEAGADPDQIVVAVPSGNLGNLAAALLARRMGLPLKRIVAATNANDAFTRYLTTGILEKRQEVATHANAMDTSAPANLPRVAELMPPDPVALTAYSISDEEILQAISDVYNKYGYVTDPHAACAYSALRRSLQPGEHGIFMATADASKCRDVINRAIPSLARQEAPPARPQHRNVQPHTIPATYQSLKTIILQTNEQQTHP